MKSERSTPTKQDLLAARDRGIRDIIAPDLKVLLCGINPGLYTAAVGHHFARPGNRFWPALHRSGFTPRLLRPHEERELLEWGYGITNLVNRATAQASELSREELIAGARLLERKARLRRPRAVAILGVHAYRVAFARPDAGIGPQPGPLGPSAVWVLPSPSGLNAHFQLPELARLFARLLGSI